MSVANVPEHATYSAKFREGAEVTFGSHYDVIDVQ